MTESKTQQELKNYLLNVVLSSDVTIEESELKLIKVLVRVKLAELNVQVNKLDEKADSTTYNNILLTAITLKCILSLANKIQKDNNAST